MQFLTAPGSWAGISFGVAKDLRLLIPRCRKFGREKAVKTVEIVMQQFEIEVY